LSTYQHPASLGLLQQFRQACSILKHTSRATNPAWYQDALELKFQLHIRPNGPDFSTFYRDGDAAEWRPGPELNEAILEDPDKLQSLAKEVLRTAAASGANALGVVLHIADEFATTELKPEFDNPAALGELRNAALSDPGSILEDSSVSPDHASWRLLPYPAVGSETIATAVTITRTHAALLNMFRRVGEAANFPVITHALSAPLVALMGLAHALKPAQGKSFVAVLQYPWFTVLAFFSDHADLRLVRTLQHRGVRRPSNFRSALTTTSASLEFVDPDLFVVPLGEAIDTTLEGNLQISFPNSRVELVRLPIGKGLPAWCPEPVILNEAVVPGETLESFTFNALREDRWATQDFLPTPTEVAQIYPERHEMRLMRALKLARVALFAITILALGYFALGIVDLIRRPAWAFDPSQAEAVKSRLARLTVERQRADHWNNLLEDRSKAWVSMESLVRLFPENGGVLVKGYTYNVKPESAAGQAKAGFVKEWKISGFARDEALEYLNTLNTREGISSHFAEVAKITGNNAYDPTVGNRSISVNVKTLENNSFKPAPPEESHPSDQSTYPFTFDLTITQRYEATDPLALTTTKAP
jgi:hypothetical protein